MRADVNVRGIAFERGAVTFFRFGQFAALKINVAQLKIVVSVVEVMDLRLKFLDAFAALRAGQFKSTRRGRRRRRDRRKRNKGGPRCPSR